MLEHALIAACIAVVAIASLGFVGTESQRSFFEVGEEIEEATGGSNVGQGSNGSLGG